MPTIHNNETLHSVRNLTKFYDGRFRDNGLVSVRLVNQPFGYSPIHYKNEMTWSQTEHWNTVSPPTNSRLWSTDLHIQIIIIHNNTSCYHRVNCDIRIGNWNLSMIWGHIYCYGQLNTSAIALALLWAWCCWTERKRLCHEPLSLQYWQWYEWCHVMT